MTLGGGLRRRLLQWAKKKCNLGTSLYRIRIATHEMKRSQLVADLAMSARCWKVLYLRRQADFTRLLAGSDEKKEGQKSVAQC